VIVWWAGLAVTRVCMAAGACVSAAGDGTVIDDEVVETPRSKQSHDDGVCVCCVIVW
jgi:hypothetical protein